MRNGLNCYEIALIQMECVFFDTVGNIEKAEKMIRRAAAHGAKLICLPEAFHTGYIHTRIPEMIDCAEIYGEAVLAQMTGLAGELQVFLLVPILFTALERVENKAFLIDDEGNIVGSYSKTHLTGTEAEYFHRGNQYPVFDTKLGKIGISICYDICFPETIRILALSGAEVVLVPAAWRSGYYYKEWWDMNISCRALDNLLFVAAVNHCGKSGDEYFAGKSQICDPIGKKLAVCTVEEEMILYGTIDLSRVEEERMFNTVLRDRKPEDYRSIVEGGNVE